MLHKMTCLPLSDFAFTKKKLSAEKFEMSEQNISALMSFHEQSIWFYNYNSEVFDRKFGQFQREFCDSVNCEDEIKDLKEENKKLEESCGLYRLPNKRLSDFKMDMERLKNNSTLALRCLSFALSGNSFKEIDVYNGHIENNSKDIERKIVRDWMAMLQNKSML